MKALKGRLDQRKKNRMTKRERMKRILRYLPTEPNPLLKAGFGADSQVI